MTKYKSTKQTLIKTPEKWLITGSAIYINGDGETSRDFRPEDVCHSLADISRARQFIDYEPQFSVTQGLDMAAAWYMERGF